MSYVECHVDGSVLDNGTRDARGGYGVAWTRGVSGLNSIQRPLNGDLTVSRAEAEAVRAAVNQASSAGYREIVIHTDSAENIRGLQGNHTVNSDVWNQVNELKQKGMVVRGVQMSRGTRNQAHDLAQRGAKM